VMRQAGHDRPGLRVRGLIAVLWRGGLRVSEALALSETDVDERRGSLSVCHGKGDKRREAGMDEWGFEQLSAWLAHRAALPVGPLFCVIDGVMRGRAWAATAARAELRQLAGEAGVRRRFAPHQLRHAHAVELAREGVAVNIIQRQLGHTDLGTTSTYAAVAWPMAGDPGLKYIADNIGMSGHPDIRSLIGLDHGCAAKTWATAPPLKTVVLIDSMVSGAVKIRSPPPKTTGWMTKRYSSIKPVSTSDRAKRIPPWASRYPSEERWCLSRVMVSARSPVAISVSPQSADVSEFENTTLGISFIALANGPEAVGQ
jgi:hypothetical protein